MRKAFLKDIKAIVMEARGQMRALGARRFDARAHPWPDEGWLGDFWHTPQELAICCEAGKEYRLIGYEQDYDGGKGSIIADAIIRIPTREEFAENPKPSDYVLEATRG